MFFTWLLVSGLPNFPEKFRRQASAGKVDTKSAELVDETGGIFDVNFEGENGVGKKTVINGGITGVP